MAFDLQVHDLKQVDYVETWQLMKEFSLNRDASTADAIWVCEHPAVFTLGQAGKESHILCRSQIPVVKTDRGGQVTYHGPGQLVIYPLIYLNRYGLKVREYVHLLEQCLIDVLTDFGLEQVQRKENAPGVYVPWGPQKNDIDASRACVPLAKIAALGIKIRKGFAYHGLALNVDMNLQPFQFINPCGYAGMQTIDLRTTGVKLTHSQVKTVLVAALVRKFKELCRD